MGREYQYRGDSGSCRVAGPLDSPERKEPHVKTPESWVTLVLMGALVLLIVTHAGGFATDVVAGGSVLNSTVKTLGGVGNTAGVNYPSGVAPNLAG